MSRTLALQGKSAGLAACGRWGALTEGLVGARSVPVDVDRVSNDGLIVQVPVPLPVGRGAIHKCQQAMTLGNRHHQHTQS